MFAKNKSIWHYTKQLRTEPMIINNLRLSVFTIKTCYHKTVYLFDKHFFYGLEYFKKNIN